MALQSMSKFVSVIRSNIFWSTSMYMCINKLSTEKHCKNQLNCDVSEDNPKIRKFWNCCLALTQQISSVFSDTQLTTIHKNTIVSSRCLGFANSLFLVKWQLPILIFTVFAKSSSEISRFRQQGKIKYLQTLYCERRGLSSLCGWNYCVLCVFVCFGFEFGDHFIFPKPKQKGMVPLSLTFNPDQGQNWFICFRFSFFSHPKWPVGWVDSSWLPKLCTHWVRFLLSPDFIFNYFGKKRIEL